MKTESIVVRLLLDGVSPDKLLLSPAGPFRRRYAREVEKIAQTETGHFKGHVVTLNRSGLYDHLPEQLFHLRTEPASTLGKKVAEIRRQRRKEQESRRFFLPIDHEFGLQRVAIEANELRSLLFEPGSGIMRQLRSFWEAPPEIGDESFLRLLPKLPLLSGKPFSIGESEKIMEALLGEKTCIKEVAEPDYLITESPRPGREMHLGINTVLGGRVNSGLPAFTVTIYAGKEEQWVRYMADNKLAILISWITRKIFPAGTEVGLKIYPPGESQGFRLSPGEPVSGRLSYTTVL